MHNQGMISLAGMIERSTQYKNFNYCKSYYITWWIIYLLIIELLSDIISHNYNNIAIHKNTFKTLIL